MCFQEAGGREGEADWALAVTFTLPSMNGAREGMPCSETSGGRDILRKDILHSVLDQTDRTTFGMRQEKASGEAAATKGGHGS